MAMYINQKSSSKEQGRMVLNSKKSDLNEQNYGHLFPCFKIDKETGKGGNKPKTTPLSRVVGFKPNRTEKPKIFGSVCRLDFG